MAIKWGEGREEKLGISPDNNWETHMTKIFFCWGGFYLATNWEFHLTREKVMSARLNPTVLVPACSSSRLTQKVITNLKKRDYLERVEMKICKNLRSVEKKWGLMKLFMVCSSFIVNNTKMKSVSLLMRSDGSKHCPDIAAWSLQSNGKTLKHRVNRKCQHRENVPGKRNCVKLK